jgi:hypothetical protein
MHYLSSVYFINQPLHVSGIFVAHHQEVYCIYRVSQEECARFREGVPYVKVYRCNLKHLCPKLNGYGDNGQRKVWSSFGFHALYLSANSLMHACPSVWCHITAVQLTLSLNGICTSFRVIM